MVENLGAIVVQWEFLIPKGKLKAMKIALMIH